MANHSTPFQATRWSLVLRAQGDSPVARAALSELCETYYDPVYRFLRREGRSDDSARELAQSFFVTILEQPKLKAEQGRGKFRSYLLGALKHFLADQRKLALRKKRGAGALHESLDDPEGKQIAEPSISSHIPTDHVFDREWAMKIMETGLKQVQSEWEEKDRGRHFDMLKHTLTGEHCSRSQQSLAQELDWSESAVKVGIHRLRKRFREAIRTVIADTIPESEDVDAELRYLIEILREAQASNQPD